MSSTIISSLHRFEVIHTTCPPSGTGGDSLLEALFGRLVGFDLGSSSSHGTS